MSLTGLGNKLDNSYIPTKLASTKGIVKDGTTTDNVLDLSGDPKQIANEILNQDVSKIKAINVNGQLVQLKSADVEKLITELKSKCFDGDNLKADFKFVNFSKSTGICVVESKLDPAVIENINKTSLTSEKLMSDIPKYKSLLGISISNSDTITKPDLHNKAAATLIKAVSSFDQQVSNVNNQIKLLQNELSKNPGDLEINKQITLLQGQAKVLASSSNMLKTNAQAHAIMAKMGNGETTETNKIQINQLVSINQKLDTQMSELNSFISEQPNNLSPEMSKAVIGVLKKSNELHQKISDVVSFCNDPKLISTQKEYGSAISLPGLMVQYDSYQTLARNGEHLRQGEKREGDGSYLSSKSFTPDANGFKLFSAAGVENSKIYAEKFSQFSDKIHKMDFSTPTDSNSEKQHQLEATKEIEIAKARASLESSIRSSLPSLKHDNVNQVVKIYMDEFDLAHAQSLANQTQKSANNLSIIDKPNEALNGKILVNNIEAANLTENTGTKRAVGFGTTANGTLTGQNTQNIDNKGKIKTQTEQASQRVKNISSEQKKNETSDDQIKSIDSLESAANGSKVEIHIGIGARIGTKDDHVQANVNLKAIAEKSYGMGPSYLLHLDWSAKVQGKLSLGDVFEAEFGLQYQAVLAGVSFSDTKEVREYVNAVKEMVTAKVSGTDEELKIASEKVHTIVTNHSYEASSVTGELGNSIKFGKSDISKFGKKVILEKHDSIYNTSCQAGSSPSNQCVRDESITGQFKLGAWEGEIKGQRSIEYTDKSFSTIKKSDVNGKPMDQIKTRTVVELKIPGSVLLNILKSGNLDSIPAPVLSGAIAQIRQASGGLGLANLTDSQVIKKITDMISMAKTDAALIGKLAPLSAADDKIKDLQRLKKPIPVELEAAFSATLGFEFAQSNPGEESKFSLRVGFNAKFDATAVIPTSIPSVSITVNGGMEIVYAKSYSSESAK
ncbi:MAG: hypothetical protein H7263_05735 [Candidatus Sericytochromatia bacterium]|nr:hypothetical protein [Candidatus Sericytochromatia bacterium]